MIVRYCFLQQNISNTNIVSSFSGKFGYSICFDNVNTKITVRHLTKDKKNKMFNMVQAFAAKDRIASLHLSDEQPSPNVLRDIPFHTYFPTAIDEATLRSEMTVLVTRVISKHLQAFDDVQNSINNHIQHRYSSESAKKSEMVSLQYTRQKKKNAPLITVQLPGKSQVICQFSLYQCKGILVTAASHVFCNRASNIS